jgi:hypothetical protein
MTVGGSLVRRGLMIANRFERDRQVAAATQQQRVLESLMKQAQHTAFGKAYRFDQLLQSTSLVQAFQEAVPTHSYEQMFDGWWQRALEGEANVAWPEQVRHFALSSGTSSDTTKYIPVTHAMTRSMRQGAFKMFSCLPKYDVRREIYFKEWMMVGGSADLQDLGTCLAGDLSGINASRPPAWLKRFYRPGTELARIGDWDERLDAIAKNAWKWDIGIMTGVPSWVQLTLERIIEYYGLANIHELWPNLSVFVSGGIAFEPYRRSLEQLFGHPLIYQDSYLASEGFIAYQTRPETSAMRLVLNGGLFFEFVPFNENNFNADGTMVSTPEIYTIEEVEEGTDYALLLSSNAGAWRYLIGDTIRFTNKDLSEIIITGRTKHFLSICGEHLSVDNMNQAVRRTEEQLDIDMREFTVAGVRAGSHFAHRWYIGCTTGLSEEKVARILDEQLCAVNDDYRTEREAMLQEVELRIVPPHIFHAWQRQQGKMNGQSKFPRVMQQEQFAKWEAFVAQQLQAQ